MRCKGHTLHVPLQICCTLHIEERTSDLFRRKPKRTDLSAALSILRYRSKEPCTCERTLWWYGSPLADQGSSDLCDHTNNRNHSTGIKNKLLAEISHPNQWHNIKQNQWHGTKEVVTLFISHNDVPIGFTLSTYLFRKCHNSATHAYRNQTNKNDDVYVSMIQMHITEMLLIQSSPRYVTGYDGCHR